MKILVLNYEFPPIGGGGGRAAEDICRGLAALGHEIVVQTAHMKGLAKRERRDGYTIHRTWAMRRRADTCSVMEMLIFLITNTGPSLMRCFQGKPDLIHVHFAVPTGILGWVVAKITGIPYVLSVQLGDVPGGVPEQTDHLFKIIKPFTVPVWRDAAALTAPSRHISELALQSYDVSLDTVPNSVDLTHSKQSPSTPHTPKRIVFAGRFNPQKNLLFLAQALIRIADLEWEMEMLGDGPMMHAVRSLIGMNGLQNRVFFRGWVSPETVEETMAHSDILFLPSLSEGMPLVGLRALGAGLAIAGSDIGGIQDLVQHGINGMLFPVNDMQACEKALRLLLTDTEALMSMKAKSTVIAKQFDLRTIAKQFEEIFQRILKK